MTDNIIEFPTQTDDLEVEVTFDVVDDVFYGLQLFMKGMLSDEVASYQDCVDGAILAACWAAREAGYTADQLQHVFHSVRVEPEDE